MSEPSYPRVVLVDAPTFSANVRFDLNSVFGSAICLTNSDGFSLGAPTLDVEPGAVGGTYGYRSITLTPRIEGPKAPALSLLAALNRELLRWENWLLVQLDELTEPVWFHIYQSPPSALSLDEVYVDDFRRQDDAWQTTLNLTADAFALGERITFDPIAVTQSSDGSHPLACVLPAIKGDASTPLRVRVETANSQPDLITWLLSSVSVTDVVADPILNIGFGDGLTNHVGTHTPDSSSAYYGGSYRQVDVSAIDAPNSPRSFAERLTGPFPTVPEGKYKVMLRYEADATPGQPPITYTLQLQITDASGNIAGPVQTQIIYPNGGVTTGGTFQGWADLGNFTLPSGYPTPSDITAPLAPSQFSLRIGTQGNVPGTLRLDALKLIPVDGRNVVEASSLFATLIGRTLSGDMAGTWDGETESFWLQHRSSQVVYPSLPSMRGGFPTANPAAASNVLEVIAVSGPPTGVLPGELDKPTSTGAVASVTVSYQPRYLHLPGDPDA